MSPAPPQAELGPTPAAHYEDIENANSDLSLAAEVRACLPVLPVLTGQLQAAARVAESVITGLCNRFHVISDRATRSVQHAAATLGEGAEEGSQGVESMCRLIQSALQGMVDCVLASVRASQEAAEQIETANRLLGGSDRLLRDICQLASRARVLSLNAKIEAARAGDAGRTFSILADEVGSLAGHAWNLSSGMQTTLKQAGCEVASVALALRRRAQAEEAEAQQRTAEVRGVLEVVAGMHGKVQGALRESASTGEALAQDLNAAVVDLQFQDALSQRIGHVVSTLGEVERALAARVSGEAEGAPGDWVQRVLATYTMAQERDAHNESIGAGSKGPDDDEDRVELF